MTNKQLNIVRESLQAYADRGVFRGFSEIKTGRFQFVWLIRHQMELRVNTARRELTFHQLLPGVAARSALAAEVKRFVAERHDDSIPEHRRIERSRADVICFARGSNLSLTLNVKDNQYAYGINKLVNLVNELFVYLRDVHPEYLMENFDVPQE